MWYLRAGDVVLGEWGWAGPTEQAALCAQIAVDPQSVHGSKKIGGSAVRSSRPHPTPVFSQQLACGYLPPR